MVIYGENGKSEELPLVSEEENNYRPEQTDKFKVMSKSSDVKWCV